MDKVVFVMDKPEKCTECPIGQDKSCCVLEVCIYCIIAKRAVINSEAEKIPDWCPLNPLPDKFPDRNGDLFNDARAEGWNACIDAICKE